MAIVLTLFLLLLMRIPADATFGSPAALTTTTNPDLL